MESGLSGWLGIPDVLPEAFVAWFILGPGQRREAQQKIRYKMNVSVTRVLMEDTDVAATFVKIIRDLATSADTFDSGGDTVTIDQGDMGAQSAEWIEDTPGPNTAIFYATPTAACDPELYKHNPIALSTNTPLFVAPVTAPDILPGDLV